MASIGTGLQALERKQHLLSLLVVCCLGAGYGAAAIAAERPGILFICTDDHTYRTVNCYPEAYAWARTPTIDWLAREGVRFESAYIGIWCMWSHAELLTAHQQFGVESMRLEDPYPGSAYDPKKCPFWPSEFRKQGYVTAQIGKWHTGYDRDWV